MSARYIHNKILQYKKPQPLQGGIPLSVSYLLVLGGYWNGGGLSHASPIG